MNVEHWLAQHEKIMILTIKNQFFHSYQQQDVQEFEEWVGAWPGQTSYLASQVWFTKRCEAIFKGNYEREKYNSIIEAKKNAKEYDSDEEEEDM